jgi:hypothetical protein
MPLERIDYGRLTLETAAALLGALLLTFLPAPSTWKPARMQLSNRSTIALFGVAGCLICFWGAWRALQISRPFPANELAKLDGQGAPLDGVFSGKVYNGSDSWTVREITIGIVMKVDPPKVPPPPGFESDVTYTRTIEFAISGLRHFKPETLQWTYCRQGASCSTHGVL